MKVLAILLLLAGCNIAQQRPGAIQCFGDAKLAGNGSLDFIGGGNGMLMFSCGPGAYIRQGADISGAPDPVIPPPQPPPQPAPAPLPSVVQPHRPPVPPPLKQSWAPETDQRSPPRGLVPYIHTIPTTTCQPGWTATAWIDAPGMPYCR